MDTKKQAGETKPNNEFGTAPSLPPNVKRTVYTGTLLKERYIIEGELGRGGIGVVYLARDTQLMQRRVVIKVLLEEAEHSLHTPWFRKKFDQEIEALARLDHPGIVSVLDAGAMPDGKPFFVMQYVEGVTLRSLMESGKMDFARAARILRQIGHALTSAHDKGIIHRDLKPENIMVQGAGEEETTKLIDFGIASVRDSQVATDAKTKVAGALPYMAPEQLRGQPEAASDIWSLGVIAYEMLTGRMPFYAETLVALHEVQRSGLGATPKQLRPDLPEAAERAVLKALAFNANQRQARARDFGDEVARALSPAAIINSDAYSTRVAGTEHIESPFNQPTVSLPPQPPTQTSHQSGARTAAQNELLARQSAAQAGQLTAQQAEQLAGQLAGQSAEQLEQQEKKITPLFLPLFLVGLALLAGVVAYIWFKNSPGIRQQQNGTASPTPVVAATRQLDYSITSLPAKGAAVELPGEIVFTPGDRLRLNLTSPQAGYFYLINEGPEPQNGLPAYNFLYPAVGAATTELPAGRKLSLPSETEGYPVDQDQGTETLWLVWAERPLASLEEVRKAISAQDWPQVKAPDTIKTLQSFFQQNYPAAKPVAEKNEVQTHLRGGRDGLLVYPLRVQHR